MVCMLKESKKVSYKNQFITFVVIFLLSSSFIYLSLCFVSFCRAFLFAHVFLGGSMFNLSGSFFKLCHRTKQRTAYSRLIRSGVLLDMLHTKLYGTQYKQQCAFSQRLNSD